MNEVINFLKENDLSESDNYIRLNNLIDIDSYIDYIIIQTYICNTDWPNGNSKWWRDKTSLTNSKWRWIVFDTDWSLKGKDNIDQVWIGDLYGNYLDKRKNEGFYLFNNLINNKEFKKRFLNRYMFFLDNVFEEKRFENIVLLNKSKIELEYENSQRRWNTLSENNWSKAISEMIEFNTERNKKMEKIITELQGNEE